MTGGRWGRVGGWWLVVVGRGEMSGEWWLVISGRR